jgi:hypothetical protein
LDSERGRGEEGLRGEAAERPASDPPRVDPVGDAAEDAWTATPRRAGSGVTRGRVGAEEEARLEESVRRGTRRAMDQKEQEESGSGGLYGSQIDASHILGAAIAELSSLCMSPFLLRVPAVFHWARRTYPLGSEGSP